MGAKEFGVHGQLFEIGEVDKLQAIKYRLAEMAADGVLQEKLDELKSKSIESIMQPSAVDGIGEASRTRKWVIDVEYKLDRDLYDHQGTKIAARGTVIEPLEKVRLPYTLIFLNADSQLQLKWLSEYVAIGGRKVVLVRGSPIEAMKKLAERVYFDQRGILVQKFGIRNVPATVWQEDGRLWAQEWSMSE